MRRPRRRPTQADLAVAVPLRTERAAGATVLLQTARRAVRSGLVWGYVFGVLVASSAISYTRIYATQAERDGLAAAFGTNHATAALFGPAPDLQTVAGFTVFKSFMTIVVLGALWGLLTSTRLLRGEEDAGRWELLLTGRSTPSLATLQALGGLAAGLGALWLVTAVITVLTGQYSKVDFAVGPSLYFAVAQVATPAMFLAVGAVTSQLRATRRQAAALAGWILGASYAVRMVADAGVGLHGLIWVTPLGWVEELEPLTAPRPLALLPIVAFTVVLCLVALGLAGRRDAGGSIVPDRSHARARLRLLSGQVSLSIRLVRPVVVGWVCALAVAGLVLGLIAKEAGGTVSGSSVKEVFTRLGASGTGAEEFLGVAFLIVAVLAGFMAAGQITAARAEEAEGRLEHLVVEPVSRRSWLGGRLLVATGALVAGGVVAGVAAWLGSVSQGTGIALGTLLQAGLNVVPAALCLLGIGTLAFGAWPRVTAYVVYGVLGWSLLVEVVGGFGWGRRWLLDTSLFHQMAAAPAVNPDWITNVVMLAIGVVCAVAGGVWLARRDLRGA
jgi:ABC-2 type transport system permease protein